MFIFYYFLWQCVSHLKASFSSYQHRQGNLNTSCKLLLKPSIVTNTVWFRYNPPPPPHSVSCWVTRVGGASSACWGGRGWPTMWSPATRGSTSQTSASCFSPSRWLNKIVGSTQKHWAGHAPIFQLCNNDNATTRQCFTASATSKNSENVKATGLIGVATMNIDRKKCNKQHIFGLKTWSRCRGSVVECPALQKHH